MNSQTTSQACFSAEGDSADVRVGRCGKTQARVYKLGLKINFKIRSIKVFVKKFWTKKENKASENCSEILKYPQPVPSVGKFFYFTITV